jgi:hypothetical protein
MSGLASANNFYFACKGGKLWPLSIGNDAAGFVTCGFFRLKWQIRALHKEENA